MVELCQNNLPCGWVFVSSCVLFLFCNVAALEIILSLCFDKWKKSTTFANVKSLQNTGVCLWFEIFLDKYMGKSYTASSLRILQGLTAAKVVGCSGAM